MKKINLYVLRRFMSALYPTFSWIAEPVSNQVERHTMIYQRPASGAVAYSEHETQ